MYKRQELRKTIGTRVKTRRKELKLTQDYLADKLDVNKSTIQRYESGTIDNTKKLVVEGLAKACLLYTSTGQHVQFPVMAICLLRTVR